MKKKILIMFFMAVFLVVVTACSSNTDGSSDSSESSDNSESSTSESTDQVENSDGEPINLRLNAGLNSEDANTMAFVTPWVEAVESQTNVTFDSFFNEELVPMGEEVRALKDGTIDLAAVVLPTYNPDLYPLSDVPMLPLKYSDSVIAAKAYADLIASDVELQDGKTFTDLEFGQHDMKALPVQPVSEYTIGATSGHEFKTADDFKGLNLRAGGRAHEIFVEQLGSRPVSMPWSEEFEALSRGALDGTVRSVVDYKPYGFDEMLTNSIEGLAIGHFPLVWLMPEDKWNELPEDVRAVMEEEAYALAESTAKKEAMDNSIEQAKSDGITFTPFEELDDSAKELLEEATYNTWMAWIEAKEAEGLPGKEAAILWRDLVVQHGGEVFDSIMEIE